MHDVHYKTIKSISLPDLRIMLWERDIRSMSWERDNYVVGTRFYVVGRGGAFTNRNGPERTGTDRNGQEWTSITGTDHKIYH